MAERAVRKVEHDETRKRRTVTADFDLPEEVRLSFEGGPWVDECLLARELEDDKDFGIW